jgi:hypothetical protein
MVLAPTTAPARIADTLCAEPEFGVARKSRSINDLERIQAQTGVFVLICG